MKAIMVPVSNRPESGVALKIATELATTLEANIVACHLRPHRDRDEDYAPSGLALLASSNRRLLEELKKKSTRSAAGETKKLFTQIVGEAEFKVAKRPALNGARTAIWTERTGSPDRLMAIMGPVADLTVLTRPNRNGQIARMFVLAALLHAGRPVMVLPQKQKHAPGKRIAIAWNQSAEVSRTIAACMPMLQAADQVTIISCGPENRTGPKSARLKDYLRNYQVNAAVVSRRGRNEEAELLKAYSDTNSDLLLMGAYSRTRLREIVFGGMTEYMLWAAKIPLILQRS